MLNVPNYVTEEELGSIFGQFGPVSNISINQKGFAYVSYNNFDNASLCLRQMKANPYSFPGFPQLVVKFASSKEERASIRNFLSNNGEGSEYNNTNLNIQFNYLFVNPEIKTELDLDKEIRLFIKVVMLMDYIPKDVLVDFESMSGLVFFPNYHDYHLFLRKYEEFCSKQMPYFECLPYEMPVVPNEGNNFNNNFFPPQINNNYMFNQYNQNQYIQNQNNNKMMNNNIQRRNNDFANANMGMIEDNNMNMRNVNNPNNFNNINNRMSFNYMNNPIQKNYKFAGNNNNMQFKNNNNGMPYNKNSKFNNNRNGNRKTIIQKQKPNNNQKVILRQNYGNSYNININMNQNMMPMNPFIQQQMMAMVNQNRKKFNNNRINNMRQQMDPMNYQNNFNNFPNKKNFINDSRNENYRNKNDNEFIDQRNLQNLNPSQLQSQFNKPPINVYGPNMLNSKEQEDLINEIADSIYEIVCAKYPNEASKITGMIKEKGYEKMNMLLSKQEDLNEIIDKAYEMINNSRNKSNNEDGNDNK